MSLFDVESYFLLGHFQACVNSGHSFPADISKSHIQLKPLSRRTIPMLFRFTHFHCNSPSDQQSDIFLNRAHIELGNYSIVVDEIRYICFSHCQINETNGNSEDAPAALKCVKLLARLHLGEIQPQELLAQCISLLSYLNLISVTSIEESNAHVNDPHLQVVLGAAFIRLQQYENALNVLNSTPSYEGYRPLFLNRHLIFSRALLIQMFLQMNRPDVAAKEFSRLQSMKDDAIATQLSSTWINLAMGQNRVTDALETFQV